MQETESAEYRSFQRHYADLLEDIRNPTTLAARLYSAGLLSRKKKTEISFKIFKRKQTLKLLDVIKTSIKLEPGKFHKFVVELQKDSSLNEVCGKLRSTCGECVSSDVVYHHHVMLYRSTTHYISSTSAITK